jgi:hypothetical protein
MRFQTMRLQIFLIVMFYTAGVNADLYAAVKGAVKAGDTVLILDGVWHAFPEAVAWPLIVYRVKGLLSSSRQAEG